MFDEQTWEERYRSRETVWSGHANPQLEAEATDLTPGTALDVGSGEGGDALWLAARGWRVTAVDFSRTALQRGAARAEQLGPEVADRVRWVHADLRTWIAPQTFDLVSCQFMHLPEGPRRDLFERLASAVAPGGRLLVVGHHPSDLETSVPRPPMPELFYSAEEVARDLDHEHWDVLVTQARPRTATDPDGAEVTVHDTVLLAQRRR